jgi:hypothetical protein
LDVRLVLVSDMLRALQFWLTKSARPDGQFELMVKQSDGSILEK